MNRIKPKYKVDKYFRHEKFVIKENEGFEERPNINKFVNLFAPKLSACYSIQIMELQESGKYKIVESWYKTKKGWKQC